MVPYHERQEIGILTDDALLSPNDCCKSLSRPFFEGFQGLQCDAVNIFEQQ